MTTKLRKLPGPKALFRGKVRAPVSLTLTPEHHRKVKERSEKLKITRADLIGQLIERYADVVTLEPAAAVDAPDLRRGYERLQRAVAALGATLEHKRWNGPRGKMWILSWGGRHLEIDSDSKLFTALDNCYQLKSTAEVADGTVEDALDAGMVAQLFGELAKSPGPS